MACVKNVKNVIKSVRGTINPYYDMTSSNVRELYDAYPNQPFELICSSFKFGYLQGMKAARAEMKRREK